MEYRKTLSQTKSSLSKIMQQKLLLLTVIIAVVLGYCIAALPFKPKPLLRSAYGEIQYSQTDEQGEIAYFKGKVFLDSKNSRYSQQLRLISSKYSLCCCGIIL
jgi:hypothetical protein